MPSLLYIHSLNSFSSQARTKSRQQSEVPNLRISLPSGHGASPNFSPGTTYHSLPPALNSLESFWGLPLFTLCLRRLPFLLPLFRTPELSCSFPPFSPFLASAHPRPSLYDFISDRDSCLETISLLFKQQRRYVLNKAYRMISRNSTLLPSFSAGQRADLYRQLAGGSRRNARKFEYWAMPFALTHRTYTYAGICVLAQHLGYFWHILAFTFCQALKEGRSLAGFARHGIDSTPP